MILLISCGGSDPSYHSNPIINDNNSYLCWVAPVQYEDNTVLNPNLDLSGYYIYGSFDGVFNDNTEILAEVVGNINEFNLNNLNLVIDNTHQFICLKAISKDNVVSKFSESVFIGG